MRNALLALMGSCPVALGQVVQTEHVKLAPTGPCNFVAESVAVDGDRAVVGATACGFNGRLYLYMHTNLGWTQQPWSGSGPSTRYGHAIAIDGATVAVGSPANWGSGGDVGVFVLDLPMLSSFLIPAPAVQELFGESVALDGDTLAVGAPRRTYGLGSAGAVFAFVRSGTSWAQEQEIVAPDGQPGDFLGGDVDVSGDTIVAAAWADQEPGGMGSVYVFVRQAGAWFMQAKLPASHAFGTTNTSPPYVVPTVAISGDTIAIGMPDGVRVHERSGGTWGPALSFSPLAPTYSGGFDVDLDGDRLVVGASAALRAFVYERNGTGWMLTRRLRTSDSGSGNGETPVPVAVSGDWIFLGATREDATYVYGDPEGEALCFGDGTGAACPCGNTGSAGTGCAHSAGGGMTISSSGSTSITSDDLTLIVSQCPPRNTGLFVAGTDSPSPPMTQFDGLLCVDGIVRWFRGSFQTTGTVTEQGFAAQDPFGTFFKPSRTVFFQYWSRDNQLPSTCGTGANTSPAHRVIMAP